MFCQKCGKQLSPEAKFCEVCGTRVESAEPVVNNVPEPNQSVVVEPTYFEPVEPQKPVKKKGIKKIIIAVVAAVAVLTGSVAGAYFAFPGVKNTINKTFLSSKDYFKYVVNDNAGKSADDFTGILALKDMMKTGDATSQGNVKFEIGDGFKDFIRDNTDYQTYQILNWIDSYEADVSASVEGPNISSDMVLKLNGQDVTSFNMVINGNSGEVYFTLPEINPTTIKADTGMDLYYQQQAMEELEKVLAIIPDAETVKTLYVRYLTAVADQVSKVKETNETVEINGVSQKVTKLTAEIDGETISKMAVAVLKEAKEDEEIKKILIDVASLEGYSIDAETVYESFRDAIEEAIEEIEDGEEPDVSFDVAVWVNGNGEVIGAGANIEGVDISMITVENNGNSATRFAVGPKSQSFVVEGSGTDVNGIFGGEYKVRFGGMDIVDISVANVDKAKLEQNLFCGTVTFKFADGMTQLVDRDVADILRGAKLEITSNQESAQGPSTAKVALYTNNELWLAVEATATTTEGGNVDIPYDYISADDSEAMTEWVKNANLTNIVTNIKASGLPAEYAQVLDFAMEELEKQKNEEALDDAEEAINIASSLNR